MAIRREKTNREVVEFLYREAEALDNRQFSDWLDLLTDDITYKVPVRITREAGAEESEFSDNSFHYRDDRASLEGRVERFETEYAWSENPPSRTRRFISNVRVEDADSDDIPVKNNLMLYRSQGDTSDSQLITGERHDLLRHVDDDLKLAERTVYIDQTILRSKGSGLSIFL